MNNSLSKNITGALIVQLANYVMPLISVPIIVRVIGPEKYGLLNYSVAIVTYFTLLISFGFNYYGVREVNKYSRQKGLCIIFSRIVTAKFLLFILSSLFFYFYINTIVSEDFKRDLFLTYLINIAWVISPDWLYQAKLQLYKVSLWNLISKVIFTVAILVTIQSKDDYWLQPLFYSLCQIIFYVISFWYAIKKYKIKFYIPNSRKIMYVIKSSRFLFYSNVFMAIGSATIIILLGQMSSKYEVGIYTASQRIIQLFFIVLSLPISQCLFPYIGISFKKDYDYGVMLFIKTIRIVVVAGLIMSILLIAISSLVITIFYGDDFYESEGIFKILALIPMLTTINNMIGVQFLINQGFDKVYFRINVLSSVITIFLGLTIIPRFGAAGAAITWLASEVLTALMLMIVTNRLMQRSFFSNLFKLSLFRHG